MHVATKLDTRIFKK